MHFSTSSLRSNNDNGEAAEVVIDKPCAAVVLRCFLGGLSLIAVVFVIMAVSLLEGWPVTSYSGKSESVDRVLQCIRTKLEFIFKSEGEALERWVVMFPIDRNFYHHFWM